MATGSNEQNTIVIEATVAAAGRFALGGYGTVYDGVIGPWFLETLAKATGFDSLEYVIFLPPVERCVMQVVERTRARLHGRRRGPEDAQGVRRRWDRQAPRPRRSMGFCRFGCRSGLSGPRSWRPPIPGQAN